MQRISYDNTSGEMYSGVFGRHVTSDNREFSLVPSARLHDAHKDAFNSYFSLFYCLGLCPH